MSAAFASDNAAPAHPNVLAALQRVNEGPMRAYGADPVTERAAEAVRSAFDCPDAEVLFTFTGTAANIIALSAAARPWQEIFCSDVAHVLVDEAGGPVRLSGAQLTRLPSDDGLIDPQVLARRVLGRTAVHHSQPRIVSITQSTESGRVWSAAAIAEFVDRAHGLGLLVHVDGARIGNAVAALGVDPAQAIGAADIVSVGGTKNGMMFGDAILESEAILIQRRDAEPPDGLALLKRRLGGVMTARNFLMIDYNVSEQNLEAACAITPGIDSPTVSPLAKAGWVAVRAMIPRDQAQRIMDELWEAGADGILVTSIHACRI